jgi:glycosyltransferase involved in cell wall biosynthesis
MLGKKIVIHFAGSEVRGRDIYGNNLDPKIISRKKRFIRFWEFWADAIISFPEYSQLIKRDYSFIPLGYDLEYWKPFESEKIKRNTDSILIVHAPSNRKIKGTQYIIDAIEELKGVGYQIDFKLLENLPNQNVREWINASDIVVDQLIVGWHGALAIEAMALEKPVLCNINDEWRQHPKCKDMSVIPLIHTTPETIKRNLVELIENKKLRYKIGKESRRYVEEVHDMVIVAKKIEALYKTLM